MPHFLLPVHPNGPLIDAFVGVSAARHSALTSLGHAVPNPIRIRALIDTGASGTCVDPSVMKALGLTPTGQAPMTTPSTGTTPHFADQFDVSFVIPCINKPPLIHQTIGVACVALLIPQGFHALVGRDILKQRLLTYNGLMDLFMLAY